MHRLLLIIWMIVPFRLAESSGVKVLAFGVQMLGVDVSHHQKRIDWAHLTRQENIQFAFVKATEGSDFEDSLFCYNWDQLAQTKLHRGAYHLFRGYGCGLEQARHFLSRVAFRSGDLAPVLDLETLDGTQVDAVVEEAKIWLQTVEAALGIKPIIYTNLNFYEYHLAGKGLEEYPLWVAKYSDEWPILKNDHHWTFWQFANDGCIEGISQKVDLNLFHGTPEMLLDLCWNPEAPVW